MSSPRADPVFLDLQRGRNALRDGAALVDARSARAFAEGHLPEAVSWPARDLHPTKAGVRTLTSPWDLAAALEARGLGADPIVIYGGRGGADAAHLWWTLGSYGHPAMYLLNGGIEAWQREGLPIEEGTTDARRPGPTTPFSPRQEPSNLVRREELQARLDDGRLYLLDTRDAEEYSGSLVAAARGGHVPGAVHLDWRAALTEDGSLRPEAELREALAPELDAPEVVTYCQSGVRAAHTLAVLTHLGHACTRLYLGSWGEWGNRDDTPVQRPHSMEVRT